MAIQPTELGSAVRGQPVEHPALERLRERLLDDAEAASVITSYDRMHHRHSRS